MIRYALKCDNDHQFESWFKSDAAFSKLQDAGMVACPACGDTGVKKAIMAPRVRPAKSAAKAPAADETPPLPKTPEVLQREKALAELKARVESNSEYVGMNFAAEARKMHVGDTPVRAIYGEAKIDEAKALIEDGVPVTPLPFMPTRKTN